MPAHHIIPVTALTVPPDRQRKEFDSAAIFDLAKSIEELGLFHAIQVRSVNDTLTLVTGERRLRAIQEHLVPFDKPFYYAGELVPAGHVPVIHVWTDDPLLLEEIELAENVKRKDLTWQEHAQATARLHHLRDAQKARFASESSLAGIRQTVAETAIEVRGSALGEAHTATRNEILVAEHLDKPEVATAPTLKDAFKALKRIEEAERNRTLAALVGETYTASLHRAFQANCLEWMALPEWESRFDVILTDPPYGTGADKFGDGAGRLTGIEHDYDDSYEAWRELMVPWARLSYLVTKPQAHAYVFCDIDRFHDLKHFMEEAGWYVFRTPFTNWKKNSGRVPLPDQGPRRQSEWLLYAIKGKKLVTAIYPDVIPTDADEQLSHGAQKPVALYTDLLRRSVRPGDWILDTFSGSGTIFPAAHEFKCVAVGVEQNPTYYGMGVNRLNTLLPTQQELPL